MFKPLIRMTPKPSKSPDAGFAQTQFLHDARDDDYSGFAPTELFDDPVDTATMPAVAVAGAAHAAASTSRSVLARAAGVRAAAPPRSPVTDEPTRMPASWVTSQWVAAKEAKVHAAAHRAREVIAAQRRPGGASDEAAVDVVPATRLGRLRAAIERLLPGEFRSLLPLFICVTVTMALISAVLPMFDKP